MLAVNQLKDSIRGLSRQEVMRLRERMQLTFGLEDERCQEAGFGIGGPGTTDKMCKVHEEVSRLPQAEAVALFDWVEELESDLWDEQIERDMLDGKLDRLFRSGHEEHRQGLTKPL